MKANFTSSDHRPSCAEILRGQSLSGANVLLTGGGSGLGLAASQALLAEGARVTVAVRSVAPTWQALGNHPGLTVVPLDLLDIAGIRTLCHNLVAEGRGLDIVIANAGIMACPETRNSEGLEYQFATNHLGHFALLEGLLPLLGRSGKSRVVAVSSGAHRNSGIRWDDPQFLGGYDRWLAYGQSKTAQVLTSVYLSQLGADRGFAAFSAEPGYIRTPLQRHLSHGEMEAAGWINEAGQVIDPIFKTPDQGAAAILWAATATELEGRGGAYCADCAVLPVAAGNEGPGVAPHAVDLEQAQRLAEYSQKLLRL